MKKPWMQQAGVLLCFLAAGTAALGSELTEARKGFVTQLVKKEKAGFAAEAPPPGVLQSVKYAGPLGQMDAYLSPAPSDQKRHPAIIWLTGGFSNSIGSVAWEKAPKDNDQSAAGFREAGIVTLYPSLRGGNENPGVIETLYGEVDDVIAAAAFLAQQAFVDPERIYLGGHSTGGTLALLVAESTPRFRAIFALGPASDIRGYGAKELPFDLAQVKEARLRSPAPWLNGIETPTYVFEGEEQPSNIVSVTMMAKRCRNPKVRFLPIPRGTHFSIVFPLVKTIAEQILHDTKKDPAIEFTHLEALLNP